MVLYSPIFGISFLPEICCAVERIHTKRLNLTGNGEIDLEELDSDAVHQSDKSEHPV